MEGRHSTSRSIVLGKSCGFLDLQESMQVSNSQEVGEHIDGNNETEKEKKESPWHRVKWTDQMVKLLITAVSYIGEDTLSDCNGGGKKVSPLFPKKGKWKAISKVMSERGFLVSPQQCEDKFNDLNKRYKKLNDILGRGTCCDVVENPSLLDLMDKSEKEKESVRKILNSKQLFYQEMCSYHNGNRLYIPHDQSIQRSLQLALRNSDDLDYHEASNEENDATEEKHALNKDHSSISVPAKRKKSGEYECLDYATKRYGHGVNGECQGNDWILSRSLQLEEQKLQIKAEMLELENQRLRWLKFSELEDKDLEKMRLENEYLKLGNERIALEIKRQEMSGCTK